MQLNKGKPVYSQAYSPQKKTMECMIMLMTKKKHYKKHLLYPEQSQRHNR